MLTDGGFVKLSGTGGLTRAGKASTDVWGRRIGKNSLPKSLIPSKMCFLHEKSTTSQASG